MSGLRQLPLPLPAPAPMRSPRFLAAQSNAAARAWLARPDAWPHRRLALWGPSGCGKSHLLREWATARRATLVLGPALAFPMPAGALAIDDADRAPARALLHAVNAAQEEGSAVLLAAEAAPGRWPMALADLTSRLRATTAVMIGPPEDALLRGLLAALFARRQLRVADSVQQWLLARLPRTHAAVGEAVDRLDRAAAAEAAPISRALARHALVGLLADADDVAADEAADADQDGPVAAAAAPSPAPPGFL